VDSDDRCHAEALVRSGARAGGFGRLERRHSARERGSLKPSKAVARLACSWASARRVSSRPCLRGCPQDDALHGVVLDRFNAGAGGAELGELDRRFKDDKAFVLEYLERVAYERLELPVLRESAARDRVILEPVDLLADRPGQEPAGDRISPNLAVDRRSRPERERAGCRSSVSRHRFVRIAESGCSGRSPPRCRGRPCNPRRAGVARGLVRMQVLAAERSRVVSAGSAPNSSYASRNGPGASGLMMERVPPSSPSASSRPPPDLTPGPGPIASPVVRDRMRRRTRRARLRRRALRRNRH
jgi:hypothetical protein